MKAVITFDMPRNCVKCPLGELHEIAFSQEAVVNCKIENRIAEGVKKYGKRAIGKRPEWCPLRKFPDILLSVQNDLYDEGYADGWNYCLDEIGGRNE